MSDKDDQNNIISIIMAVLMSQLCGVSTCGHKGQRAPVLQCCFSSGNTGAEQGKMDRSVVCPHQRHALWICFPCLYPTIPKRLL